MAFRTAAIVVAVVLLLSAVGIVGGIGLGVIPNPFKLTVAEVGAKVGPSVVTVTTTVFRGGRSVGSGFFYGKKGHVVTNAHVVSRAINITITDSLGQTYPANLEGVDQSADIAALSTRDTSAPPLVAASDSLTVGTEVVLIGNPGGNNPNTVTHGLVAGTNRQLTVDGRPYDNLIQTDAIASPGSSGGPMVDMSGQIVGMVTLGASGFAYAIPERTFDGEVRGWESTGNVLPLGPPLVNASARSLVIGSLSGFAGFTGTGNDAYGRTGWHSLWSRQPTYIYGGASVEIYLDVPSNESAADAEYKSQVSYSQSTGHMSNAGSDNTLGDEETMLQSVTPNQVVYEIVWRDRNVEVTVYLASGIPPAPDITLQDALYAATQAEAPIGATLVNYQ